MNNNVLRPIKTALAISFASNFVHDKLLNVNIVLVNNEDVVVGCDSDASGMVELAICWSSGFKGLDFLILMFVKDCDTVTTTLCDYQLIITTESNIVRPIQSCDSSNRSTSHSGRKGHTNKERAAWTGLSLWHTNMHNFSHAIISTVRRINGTLGVYLP